MHSVSVLKLKILIRTYLELQYVITLILFIPADILGNCSHSKFFITHSKTSKSKLNNDSSNRETDSPA